MEIKKEIMKYYTCGYAGFNCGIGAMKGKENIINHMAEEFGFYYEIETVDAISTCDARIYIVNEAYEKDINGEMVCIHSSHSKNTKLLLDGSQWTQNDANIFAKMKKENNYIYYFIQKNNIKILVEMDNKTVYISGEKLYFIFIYIYETLLSIYMEHSGGILFHAACCQWKRKGYLITGKSGAGKTTLMFNIIENGGVFHSNDRVAVFKDGGDIIAYSIPIPVNVPIKKMRELEAWKDRKIVKDAFDNTKVRFLVSELDQLFPRKIVTTKIDEIIVADYSDRDPEYEVISSENLEDYLEVLTPFDENHPKWLPVLACPDDVTIKQRLRELKQKVKVCRISGRNTFETFLKQQ